jgi:hypothetical protein
MGNPYLGKAMASCGELTRQATAGAAAALQQQRGSRPASAPAATYSGDRAEAERFLAYERRIQLSAAQEAVRADALSALPAPCCKQFSAATCCCKCNMARATWGLAKHLIADEAATATRVRAAVVAWHRAINPSGFTGDACFNGGCNRSFAKNGCGGMEDGRLVF